jgi:hydroxymethylpyrimidine/phosphomethylpyrimidine kinase
MRTVLTIAGSDSSGGSGIQADLRTFESLGVRGLSALTAVTAQNARGVSAIAPLEADVVAAQIETAAAESVDATKIGMLANAAIAEAVAAAIEDLELPLVVLDPVLSSTSGTRLIDPDGVQVLITELIPRALVITPNLPEAEALSGLRIRTIDDARLAARRLHDMGAAHVVIKGGHWGEATRSAVQRGEREGHRAQGRGQRGEREGQRAEGRGQTATSGASKRKSMQTPAADVVDLLFDGRKFTELHIERAGGGTNVRGTGCSYSSAVAAFLAQGLELREAAARAQHHVASLIARTYTER